MFTVTALPMSSRRRNEDNMSLYDFAKKYQENQSSSDLVKKQNATEDKVLSARLEYLKNQKLLTMKTLEKEIDLIKRRKKYGWESTRKSSVSSHHFDRASLPNTTRRWTKDNFSPAKFVKREVKRKMVRERMPNYQENDLHGIKYTPESICGPKTIYPAASKEQNPNKDVNQDSLKEHDVTECVETVDVSTEDTTLDTQVQESKEKQQKSPVEPLRKAIYPVSKEKTSRQGNVFPVWSRYSRQSKLATDTSNITVTPRSKSVELDKECINVSSVNLNVRKRSDNIRPKKLDNIKFNHLLDPGSGLNDLRFKNLESVLVPH